MGQPKERLELEGRTFLERIGTAASAAFDEVVPVVRQPTPSPWRSIQDDASSDTAPIFGVRRAIRDAEAHREQRLWVLSADVPLITSELLQDFRQRFESSEAELFVPVVDDWPQMLCAGYSTSLRAAIDRMISNENYALRGLLAPQISAVEFLAVSDSEALRNVNTPEEYESLRRRHAQADAR